MVNKSIDKVIVDSLQIDEEGYKEVKTLDIAGLIQLGIVDVSLFLQGVLDAENDAEFNESSIDYVKGYKYGKTGKF
jgi:hypothetical protein